ncbi:hypothetical protein GCM10023201_50340 [Actinomycetospora corticicola]
MDEAAILSVAVLESGEVQLHPGPKFTGDHLELMMEAGGLVTLAVAATAP